MTVTIEIKDQIDPALAEIALCVDDEGLDFLIKKLIQLRGKVDHEHLMTPAWAGAELSEKSRGGPEYSVVNHLRIVKY